MPIHIGLLVGPTRILVVRLVFLEVTLQDFSQQIKYFLISQQKLFAFFLLVFTETFEPRCVHYFFLPAFLSIFASLRRRSIALFPRFTAAPAALSPRATGRLAA